MKAKDLREKSRAELRELEVDLAQKLFELRLQKVTGKLERPAIVKNTKKDLARVLTVLNEKQAV